MLGSPVEVQLVHNEDAGQTRTGHRVLLQAVVNVDLDCMGVRFVCIKLIYLLVNPNVGSVHTIYFIIKISCAILNCCGLT